MSEHSVSWKHNLCIKNSLLGLDQSESHYNDSRTLIWRIGGLWQRDSCLICLFARDLYKIRHAQIWSLVIQNFSKHCSGIRTERILNNLQIIRDLLCRDNRYRYIRQKSRIFLGRDLVELRGIRFDDAREAFLIQALDSRWFSAYNRQSANVESIMHDYINLLQCLYKPVTQMY